MLGVVAFSNLYYFIPLPTTPSHPPPTESSIVAEALAVIQLRLGHQRAALVPHIPPLTFRAALERCLASAEARALRRLDRVGGLEAAAKVARDALPLRHVLAEDLGHRRARLAAGHGVAAGGEGGARHGDGALDGAENGAGQGGGHPEQEDGKDGVPHLRGVVLLLCCVWRVVGKG